MSKFVFSSPRKYVQGAGVLAELGGYLKELGDSAPMRPAARSR